MALWRAVRQPFDLRLRSRGSAAFSTVLSDLSGEAFESRTRSYIKGEFVSETSASAQCFSNLNPATGKELSVVQTATASEIESAFNAAEEAFNEWSNLSGAERGRVLHAASRLLREKNDEIAKIECMDSGKPLSETNIVDVNSAADCLEYFAGLAASLTGSHYGNLPGVSPESFAYTRREPLGVCVGIGAWNYPIQISAWKSAPALACGNSFIFKPSELTPITATILAEVYTAAGAPKGLFNVLQGAGDVGAALSKHKRAAKVSFTGEVGTGKKILKAAADNVVPVTLELGGKSPLIIFEDSDEEEAIKGALMANFYTQGEVCTNGTRVFVHRSIYPTFVDKLVERVKKIRIGDPLDLETTMGSLISEEHRQLVLSYIQKGVDEGARLRVGGKVFSPSASELSHLQGGFFVEPTIFDECKDDMTIVREEIFGPVMSVLPFDTEDEVVSRANDTSLGLAAGLFTKDLSRAHRVSKRLQAGILWVNNYNLAPIEVPFGGYKQSGVGRENSAAAIEHYTQLKTVYVEGGEMWSVF